MILSLSHFQLVRFFFQSESRVTAALFEFVLGSTLTESYLNHTFFSTAGNRVNRSESHFGLPYRHGALAHVMLLLFCDNDSDSLLLDSS